ncbi:hypothetical protein DY78_GL000363 [Lactiplantibacillus fabifermentans DSM 21115]|uniref:Ketopantoate reductase N-terminal domain-containing protein n=1 Tax=Lactiplantibacillus fabifermentans DSM 21115 TaxID=1413187 RepID=A0A0R2NQC8_9LACO|nr:hypothetical protein DY78_GL000363 [Lactiplantibacillus fabifermentans DSM 21115]
MKFTVLGAGAMGLRYGVLLQAAGNKVEFVDTWSPNVEKMHQQGGVYVSRDHQNRHLVPVKVSYPEDYHGNPDVWVVLISRCNSLIFSSAPPTPSTINNTCSLA